MKEHSELRAATSTGLTRVVFGPRTRLGHALLARPRQSGERRVVVARHEDDAAALKTYDATVLPVEADPTAISNTVAAGSALVVQICSLGPLHPGTARQAKDSADVTRDLAAIGRVIAAAGDRPTHVVLVSTVLALAPVVDRAYYAGWRGLVEQELRELVAERSPAAQLSVLYPGRLTERRDVAHPASLMYTTYRRLAELVDRAGHSESQSRLVGLDARAWLLARSASLGLSSVTGRRLGDGSLTSRTVRATRSDPSRRER